MDVGDEGGDDVGDEVGDDVSWVAGSCLVEHWKEELDVNTNMENVNDCLDCFRKVIN